MNKFLKITTLLFSICASTFAQNIEFEKSNFPDKKDQLKEAKCEKIFCEKITGTKRDRPELDKLLENSSKTFD